MPAPKKNLSGKVLKKILSSMPKPETGGKIGKQLDNVLKTQTKNLTKRNELIKEVNSAKANARGLKAANKPTKASKTFEGNNEKISPAYRKGMLKNSPPLREGRVRGGGMATLKKQADAAALKKKSK
jgi:hypothetical protein